MGVLRMSIKSWSIETKAFFCDKQLIEARFSKLNSVYQSAKDVLERCLDYLRVWHISPRSKTCLHIEL